MRKVHFYAALSIVFLIGSAFISTKEVYTVDASASKLKWTGYHLGKSYEHWGNVSIKSGSIEMDGDKLTGGQFVIDMTSITNGDIAKEKDNTKLVNHLKSDDFFGVGKFPEASLKIKSAENSGNSYKVTADITIRNITKEVSFDATKSESGGSVTFDATFNVERTAHEVMYGWKVENAILGGEFKMEVSLVAKK